MDADSVLKLSDFVEEELPIQLGEDENDITMEGNFRFDDSQIIEADTSQNNANIHWTEVRSDDGSEKGNNTDSDTENPLTEKTEKLKFLTPTQDRISHFRRIRNRRWMRKRKADASDNDITTSDKWFTFINEDRHSFLPTLGIDDNTNNTAATKHARKKRKPNPTPPAPPPVPVSNDAESIDFLSLRISRAILRAIRDLSWSTPTPVQEKSIPPALAGKDLLVNAVTGSGKTAAFMIPILERLLFTETRNAASRVLVVTPTRELAAQCLEMTKKLCKFTKVSIALVVGGLSIENQERALRQKPDIIICTPGRMIDLVRNSRGITLDEVEILVLDEADRLLDMGFRPEIEELVSHVAHETRQTMLFSATLSEDVLTLATVSLSDPERVSVDPTLCLANHLSQEFVRVQSGGEKYRKAMLISLCLKTFTERCIIFCRTKREAHLTRIMFGMVGLRAEELHGNLSQTDRLDALQKFRKNEVDYLLCTDVAARGLDIKNVQTVINIEFPTNIKTYIHRVGRTARAGAVGHSVTLVGESRRKLLKKLVNEATQRGESQSMKSRTQNVEFVHWVYEHLCDMKQETRQIWREENNEREMRLAHIHVTKSQNMLRHADKIFSRPRKKWFQNAHQKQQTKQDSHMNDLGEFAQELQQKIQRRIETSAQRKQKFDPKFAAQQNDEKAAIAEFDSVTNAREQKKIETQRKKERRRRELKFATQLAKEAMSGMRHKKRKETELSRTRTGGDLVEMDDNGNSNRRRKRITYSDGGSRGKSDRIGSVSQKKFGKLMQSSRDRHSNLKKKISGNVKRKTKHAKRHG